MQKNNYFSKHAIVKLCTTDTKIKFQKCTIWKLWWMDLQKNRQNVTHHGITQLSSITNSMYCMTSNQED